MITPMVLISRIRVPEDKNVRSDLPEVKRLSKSMDMNGLLEPIVVTNGGDEKQPFELVDGFRRMAAAKLLGWKEIAVHVRDYSGTTFGSAQRAIDNLVANVEREDVNNVDLSQRIHDLLTGEYPIDDGEAVHKFSQKDLCERLGKSPQYVSNMNRICDFVSGKVKREARKFKIKMLGSGEETLRQIPQKLLFELASMVKEEISEKKVTDPKTGEKSTVTDKIVVPNDDKQIKRWDAWKNEQQALADMGKEQRRRGKTKKKEGEGEGGSVYVKSQSKIEYLSAYQTVLKTKQVDASKEEYATFEGRIEVLRFILGDLARPPGATKAEIDEVLSPAEAEDEAAE